jgi:transcription initiation factor TFIIIB Brf1 subunit/transcription initiation factor TFIIB
MNHITPETLQLLAQRSGVQLKPEEIEPLSRVYVKLEQMKLLIRKPRDYSKQFAHKFQVHST